MRIAGLILAGGESRRMGTDKALVTLSGRPMIEHVIARLGPQVEALAISANGDPARFGPSCPMPARTARCRESSRA
jgi:molybdopterin-guanine dinucleotide biosynthesis protein A